MAIDAPSMDAAMALTISAGGITLHGRLLNQKLVTLFLVVAGCPQFSRLCLIAVLHS